MRVRFPHGVLIDNRAEVQMAARRFWEPEGLGSTPRRATQGSRGLVARIRLITGWR